MDSTQTNTMSKDQKEHDHLKKADEVGVVKRILSKVIVETCFVLCSLGFSLYGVQNNNIYIAKTCKVGSFFFGNGTTYSDEVCENLSNGSYPEQQAAVQGVSATVEMYSALIRQVPLVIFALFVGPWSDNVGRKRLLLFPFAGYFLTCISFILNVYFFDELYVEFLWFENVSACFGAYIIFFIGAYGYMADVTSLESRTIRMAVLDGSWFAMDVVGNYINGPIYKRFSYYGSFGAGAMCYGLGFIVVYFGFKETEKAQLEKKDTRPNVFSITNLANSFKVLLKKQNGGQRQIVILLVASFLFWSLSSGTSGVDYLYIRRKFIWADEESLISWYTHYRSYYAVGEMVSLFLILPLLVKILKLHDMSIVILASLSLLTKALIYFFAWDKSVIYVSLGCSVLTMLVTQPLRSSMTKIVGPGDTGAVFAVVAALQAVAGFFNPVYNKIYIATLEWNAGAVYLVPCGFFALMIGMSIYNLIFFRRQEKKNKNPDIVSVSYDNHLQE